MSRKLFGIMLLAGLLTVASGCKKGEESDLDPNAPHITSLDVENASVTALEDSIVFLVGYSDPDGDLGENTPGVENLFLIDNRNNSVESYRIPQLAPDGATISIAGTLRVALRNTGLTGAGPQTFQYTVYMRDRAGHESERLQSPDITVSE